MGCWNSSYTWILNQGWNFFGELCSLQFFALDLEVGRTSPSNNSKLNWMFKRVVFMSFSPNSIVNTHMTSWKERRKQVIFFTICYIFRNILQWAQKLFCYAYRGADSTFFCLISVICPSIFVFLYCMVPDFITHEYCTYRIILLFGIPFLP